jgi:membrane protease YdiL (CAAX protease family)
MTLIENYRRPLLFYGLATAIPWSFWFAAAWISDLPNPTHEQVLIETVLGLAGISAPMLIAFAMIGANKMLRRDLAGRLFNFGATKPVYWLFAFGLMPASILAAIAISLFFGYDAAQFRIASVPSFTSGLMSTWAILVLVPLLEELAWHTYGTDALVSRFSLPTTCVIFAVFWGAWHAPVFLIKGYYYSNLVHQGIWDTINFPLSLFSFVFVMNWLYYRAARNVWIAVVFHITAGYFGEFFSPHPDTKIIQTVILTVLAVVVVLTNRDLFGKGARVSVDRNAVVVAP